MNQDSDTSKDAAASNDRIFSLKRLWPLLVLGSGLAVFFGLGGTEYLSFNKLQENREYLQTFTQDNYLAAVLAYMSIYIVVVAFSLPGGAVMTITGGFLFGLAAGTVWTVIGATIGATILFIAAKTALGDALRAKAGPALRKFEAGFAEDAFSYMLILRLVPLFPFFLVNLAPAFLGVRLWTFVVTTFFGIIPGTFVYTSVGGGLGAVFDRGETPDLGIIFEPRIITPIVGLAVLAAIPIIYKRFIAKKA